jgi:hypothetical protein
MMKYYITYQIYYYYKNYKNIVVNYSLYLNLFISHFYCFMVISIEPIIANRSIKDVNINNIGILVYIIFPILVI